MNNITTRLKKINGQIQGLIRMIEEGQDCSKINIQFLAVKAAMGKAFTEQIKSNIKTCLEKKDKKDMEKILQFLAKI
jgi:DNA-binding FrmR family transcriptional regulator